MIQGRQEEETKEIINKSKNEYTEEKKQKRKVFKNERKS